MDTIGRFRRRYYMGAALGALLSFTLSTPAAVAQEQAISFDIPAQPLSGALNAYARTTGRQILFSDSIVRGLTSEPLQGRYAPQAALDRLLSGTNLSWRRSTAGALLIERAAASPQAAAAAVNASDPGAAVEGLVVTGTRIRGAAPVGAKPVIVDREEIQASGRATAGDLLRLLPQNSNLGVGDEARLGVQTGAPNGSFAAAVNLRGLGVDATLTLLNGHRLASSFEGGVVDTSQIPLLALQRVEVVTDGSSAIYGADAVAGVVNFVLRRDMDGAESFARLGIGDGFEQYTVGQAAGRTWRGGSAFAALEYYKQTPLRAADREYYTNDLRSFGGPDLRVINGIPGTLVVGGVNYALPHVSPGTIITPDQLVPGTANRRNRWEGADITPATERLAAALNVYQELTPNLEVFLDALASRRESMRRGNNVETTLTVPRSNPWFVSPDPSATSVSVAYNYATLYGPIEAEILAEDVSVHGGFELKLPRDWRASLSGLTSRSRVDTWDDNRPNSTLAAQALADPNPATAFNPFGGAGANTAALAERIRGWSQQDRRFSLNSLELEAAGSLLDLPAGPLRVALGAESRKERITGSEPSFTSGTAPTLGPRIRYARRVDAVYAEVLAPIFGPANAQPFAQSLTVSAALRGERYSDVGETWNPKLGAEWKPFGDLMFSATWGTSFKAPRLPQLKSTDTIFTQTYSLQTGPVTVITIGGNHPDLKPETAETWTAGFAYEPAWAPGLRVSATWFDVDYEDRLVRPTTAEVVAALSGTTTNSIVISRAPSEAEVLRYYNDPLFLPGTRPPPSSIFAITDARFSNIGRLRQSGFDVQASYHVDTRVGDLAFDASLTHLTRFDITRIRGGPTLKALDTTNNPVDTRATAGVSWSQGPWSAGASVHYVDGYTNTTITPNQTVDEWVTVDVRAAFSPEASRGPLQGLQLALDVRNLLDEDPPSLAHVTGAVGYDPEQANALGRVVAVTLTKRW